jgi:membrane associated rhomboid family serine protease
MMNQHRSDFFSSIPVVTKNLMIINVLCWGASLVLPKVGIDLIEWLGLHFVGSTHFNPIQFVSYMFLHDTSSFIHLFFNMFAVFMFGRTLEAVWGPKRFLLFYFVTGVGAGLIQELAWLYDIRQVVFSNVEQINLNGVQIISREAFLDMFVTIGASGAVFGVLLAFGMMFPNAPIFIMFIPIPVKAKYVVIGYGLIELTTGIANFSGDNVAHFAHLGGMLFGYIMIRYWKKKDAGNGKYFY